MANRESLILQGTPARGRNISKACEACRQRKQKCNGLDPCNICVRRGSQCSYRNVVRQRRRPQDASPVTPSNAARRENPGVESDPQVSGTAVPSGSSALDEREPRLKEISAAIPRSYIFNSTSTQTPNASQHHSPEDSHLIHGSSSNLSFLHHIRNHVQPTPPTCPGRRGFEPGHDDQQVLDFSLDGEPSPLAHDALSCRVAEPLFIRYELAQSLVAAYYRTTHCFFPVVPEDRVQPALERMYSSDGDVMAFNDIERALVLAIMAIGGAADNIHPHRRLSLLAKAKAETRMFSDDLRVEVIQIELLIISLHAYCEFMDGNQTRAYTSLGGILHKALALGLHRQSRSELSKTNCSKTGSTTFWLLYSFYNFVSLVLGLPVSLDRDDVDLPAPDLSGFSGVLVRLGEILRSVHKLYRSHETSIRLDLKAAYTIAGKLLRLSQSIQENLHIKVLDNPDHYHGDKRAQVMFTSFQYLYLMCLAFRPFLVLSVELKKQANQKPDSPKREFMEKVRLALQDACDRCISAAHHLVVMTEQVCSTQLETKWICHHELYLETAFLVIVEAMMFNESADSVHSAFATRALDCLGRVPQRAVGTSIHAGLAQILARAQETMARSAFDATVQNQSSSKAPAWHDDGQLNPSSHATANPEEPSTFQPYDPSTPGMSIWSSLPDPLLESPDWFMDSSLPPVEWNINLPNMVWDWPTF